MQRCDVKDSEETVAKMPANSTRHSNAMRAFVSLIEETHRVDQVNTFFP